MYKRVGIELEVLPLNRAGEFAEEISIVAQDVSPQTPLTIGTTEQNILIPAQRSGAAVQAVAAMFGRSPLALAALPGRKPWEQEGMGMRVGVHEDTVGLLQRLLPGADVVSVPRADKLALLRDGALDAPEERLMQMGQQLAPQQKGEAKALAQSWQNGEELVLP